MTIPEWSGKDFYATLGVGQDDSEEEVGKAYKELARKYHPDVNHDPEAAVKFKQITEAYDVLSTPDQRKLYDTIRKYFTFYTLRGFNKKATGGQWQKTNG